MSDYIEIWVLFLELVINFQVNFFNIVFVGVFAKMIDVFYRLLHLFLLWYGLLSGMGSWGPIYCVVVCTSKNGDFFILFFIFFMCGEVICFCHRISFLVGMMPGSFFHMIKSVNIFLVFANSIFFFNIHFAFIVTFITYLFVNNFIPSNISWKNLDVQKNKSKNFTRNYYKKNHEENSERSVEFRLEKICRKTVEKDLFMYKDQNIE